MRIKRTLYFFVFIFDIIRLLFKVRFDSKKMHDALDKESVIIEAYELNNWKGYYRVGRNYD